MNDDTRRGIGAGLWLFVALVVAVIVGEAAFIFVAHRLPDERIVEPAPSHDAHGDGRHDR